MRILYKGPTIDVCVGSIWPSGFRGEDFFKLSQSELGIAHGGHFVVLPSLVRSGQAVLENFFYISQSETRIVPGAIFIA